MTLEQIKAEQTALDNLRAERKRLEEEQRKPGGARETGRELVNFTPAS